MKQKFCFRQKRVVKQLMAVVAIIGLSSILLGCATPNLKAPCPNYGKSCQQQPINHWNDLSR